MKKILFILHLPPPVHGAAMMGQYIHDSELINTGFNCHYINLTTATGLEDIGRMNIKKVGRFLVLLSNILKEVWQIKPDIVYVTPNAKGGAFLKDFVIVQMLKAMGYKVVAHYHNKGVSTKQDLWLYNQLYKQFFRDLKVILLGKSLYQDVKKYVKWEDVYICPNGIPVNEKFKKDSVSNKNTVPRLLFLSNLIKSKGVFVLLDALKILVDKGYSFQCDFVGGETKEIDARRFAEEVDKRQLNKVVAYRGRKYGKEKEEFFKKSDVFVFPSMEDCFPLVLLEAMASKLPIVTTMEGAIPDIVKDNENGLISERHDSESLADCIRKLLDNPELQNKMGEDGYNKLMMYFTEDIFEKRMYEILKPLCLN